MVKTVGMTILTSIVATIMFAAATFAYLTAVNAQTPTPTSVPGGAPATGLGGSW